MRRLRLAGLMVVAIASPAVALVVQPRDPARSDPRYVAFDQAVADAKAAMMGDPQHAWSRSQAAFARAAMLPPSPNATIAIATAQWLEAESLIGSNRPGDAEPIVGAAIGTIAVAAPHSKLHGDLLRSRGAIAAIGGHVQAALADFQAAYDVFRRGGEIRSQAITLQDIGEIYWDAGDYPRVLQYYSQAGALYHNDPSFTLTSHNNRAIVLRKLGRQDEAQQQYREALIDARKLGSPLLEVRILTNLAATQIEAGKVDAADATVARALELSRGGEAAGWRRGILGVAAEVAAARHDLPRAAALLEQTFAGADLGKTAMPFREFHETAATVYEGLGKPQLALAHLKAFQRLDGEARTLTASTSAQLMAARFDFANQNLSISKLKQGQLRRDIQLERQKSQYRTTLFSGLIVAGGLVFGLLMLGFLSMRRNRNQIRASNAVLTEVNTKLEKALKAKTDFLATTSHEIRTPLNGILGMTQILLANHGVGAEIREQVEVVHGAGETMRALVDDILDVAKMETGQIHLVRETVAFRSILKDAARLWSGQAAAKQLQLTTDLDGAPDAIIGDATRLRQILFNLLSNAIKFTPSGGVSLVARVERADGVGDVPEKDAPTRSAGTSEVLVLEVRDTGVGVPTDHQRLIFEAFHQVDGGTTRQHGGTGLGLAICRNLAQALGGELLLDSAAGQGSTFTLRLPLERPAVATPLVVATRQRPVRLADSNLLLIEANGITQGLMRVLIEPAVASFAVGTADEAPRRVAAGGVDVLLIEGRSAAPAGTDALAALGALVAQARELGITTVILFAPSEALPLAQVATLGATRLIVKPLSGSDLVAALTTIFADATPAPPAILASAA